MKTQKGFFLFGLAIRREDAIAVAADEVMNCLRFMMMKVSLIVFLTMIDDEILRIEKRIVLPIQFLELLAFDIFLINIDFGAC